MSYNKIGDIELITVDKSRESDDPIIQNISNTTNKIIINTLLPDEFYRNQKLIDVPQRGFAVISEGDKIIIIGTSGLGPCTSLVLYDELSKTVAVTHVDVRAFLSAKDISNEYNEYEKYLEYKKRQNIEIIDENYEKNDAYEMIERLMLETEIKNVKIENFSPIEYNFNKMLNKIKEKIENKNLNFEIKRLKAYIVGGRTGTLSEHVIKNTYEILNKYEIALKGINILGNNCGRSFFLDTNCNFYKYEHWKGQKCDYIENIFNFFLTDYSEIDCELQSGGNLFFHKNKYRQNKLNYIRITSTLQFFREHP